jgi:twitching motility two-component system response regulator PilG
MVIDDSTVIRKVADNFLKKEGYQVILVEDGFEALVKVMEEEPDLIFVDVLMPFDGYKTCQIIRSNDSFKKIPIIFLSSKDSEFDKARGLMLGGNDYLTKPFSKESIVEIVKKYVN